MMYSVTLMVQREIEVPDAESDDEDKIAEQEDEAANAKTSELIKKLEADGWSASIESVEPVGGEGDDDDEDDDEDEEDDEEE